MTPSVIKNKCMDCGSPFDRKSNSQKYCSDCRTRDCRNENLLNEKYSFICELCGCKKINKNYIKQRFCSNHCQKEWQIKDRGWFRNRKPIKRISKCKWCSKSFLNPNKCTYCSRKCSGLAHQKEEYTYRKLRKSIRASQKYSEWRELVMRKDDYTCQICQKRGLYLEAHHLKRFDDILREYKIKTLREAYECSELWDISNGLSLCKKHHKLIHDKEKVMIICLG